MMYDNKYIIEQLLYQAKLHQLIGDVATARLLAVAAERIRRMDNRER